MSVGWYQRRGDMALQQAIQTMARYHPKQLTTTLVADGGGENHALTVEELLRQTPKPEIHKVIARKDVTFSNSSIEAIIKIMKRYLREYRPQNDDQIYQCIEYADYDYTEVRPHSSINDLTPMEAYQQIPVQLDFSSDFSAAKTKRIAQNTSSGCEKCT